MSRQGKYTAKLALFKNGMTVHYEVARDAFQFLQDLKKNNSELFDRLCESPETARNFIKDEVEQSIAPIEGVGVPEERGQLSRIVREYFCLSGKYKLTDPFKRVNGEPVTGLSDTEYCWESGCGPNYATLKSEDPLPTRVL